MAIWYHATHRERLACILRKGLRPYSPPYWFKQPAPYVMLSQEPWIGLYGKDTVILRVTSSVLPESRNDPEGLRWPWTIGPECLEVQHVGRD